MEYRLADNVSLLSHFSAQNVIRKRLTFHYSEMENALSDFLNSIVEAGGTPDGPVLYSLNDLPDEDFFVDVEFFLPLKEDYLHVEGTIFSSYFELPHLIVTSVDYNFEEFTKAAYAQLLWTLEVNGQEVKTPFYHILPTDGSTRVTILTGFAY
ncbi:TPA: DUF5085 family protein [Streptococcus suis]|nr:DUF5085 family protein [Streptococcus suis]NQI92204.1 DUF5085 family protein [Streptococcus suis]NQJ02238.1 DUF5085 family protein [Streptococcus suis]HEM6206235.1 DUF5085 family protein [Streptococcus suis]